MGRSRRRWGYRPWLAVGPPDKDRLVLYLGPAPGVDPEAAEQGRGFQLGRSCPQGITASTASQRRAVRGDHGSCHGLHRRVIGHSARAAGIGAGEFVLGRPEHDILLTAREPLGDAEDAIRVIHDIPELAYARRYGAYATGRGR